VALSPAGEDFFASVQALFAQLDQAVEGCRRAARGESGRLRLGYTGRASHQLLPRLVLAFRQRYPEVTLDIEGPLATGPLTVGVLDGALDAALCFLPVAGPGLASRSYASSELMLALPASHPLATRKRLPLSLLAGEPFVGYPATRGFHLRQAMDAECRRAGFEPRVVRETESSQVLLCLVAAGTGVSIILRELQVIEPVSGVVFRALSPKARPLSHGLVWRKNNRNPALANLLALDLAGEGEAALA